MVNVYKVYFIILAAPGDNVKIYDVNKGTDKQRFNFGNGNIVLNSTTSTEVKVREIRTIKKIKQLCFEKKTMM